MMKLDDLVIANIGGARYYGVITEVYEDGKEYGLYYLMTGGSNSFPKFDSYSMVMSAILPERQLELATIPVLSAAQLERLIQDVNNFSLSVYDAEILSWFKKTLIVYYSRMSMPEFYKILRRIDNNLFERIHKKFTTYVVDWNNGEEYSDKFNYSTLTFPTERMASTFVDKANEKLGYKAYSYYPIELVDNDDLLQIYIDLLGK